MRRSTGIKILPGAAGKKAKLLAEQAAKAMELAATGETPAFKACDAVRKTAELHGGGGKIPSVREYFADYPRTSSASSERNRSRAFTLFLEYLGADADRRIDTITAATCRGFIRHVLQSVSRGTVEIYRTYLSSAFKRAVDVDDFLYKNPFAGVNLAAEAAGVNPGLGRDRQVRQPFTLDEIRFMIQHFPEPWGDMVAVSWYTAGLRLSDVCLLRWDAVNWKGGYIRLVEKKTRRERCLPLIPALRDLLLRRLTGMDGGEEYVFPVMAHYYLGSSRTGVSTQFTALLRAHGMIPGEAAGGEKLRGKRHAVSPKSFHSIRHAVVTYLRGGMNGVSLFSADAVRDAVGHDSEEVERAYFTGSLAARERVVAELASAISAPGDVAPAASPSPYTRQA